MRVLHTSDWHLGRTFHGFSTVPQLREALGAIPAIVREHRVDVVIVAGDVFDHAAPSAESYELLAWAIGAIREAGAVVVLTSGNHDNAIRLGFQSEWAALGGVHVITKADAFRRPLELSDEHGSVDVFGVPYLEPMLQRSLYPNERLTEHATLLERVTSEIDAMRDERGNRSVVIAHCFAQNIGGVTDTGENVAGDGGWEDDAPAGSAVEGAAGIEDPGAGLQRDLTSGGVDVVPASLFAAHDYVALGHLHGRVTLAPNIRYSGAPVHFSFGESAKPRGAWLLELGAEGLETVEWVEFPVFRPLARLRGTLDELLSNPEPAVHEGSWVEATLTDRTRPIDPMRRLRERFVYCARIELAPEGEESHADKSYASRVRGKSEMELVDEFLQHVRAGEGADEQEKHMIREVIAELGSAKRRSRQYVGSASVDEVPT